MESQYSCVYLFRAPEKNLKSLPPGGRWRRRRRKELTQLVFFEKVYFDAFSLTRLRRELPPGGSHENDTPPYGLEAPPTVILSEAKNLLNLLFRPDPSLRSRMTPVVSDETLRGTPRHRLLSLPCVKEGGAVGDGRIVSANIKTSPYGSFPTPHCHSEPWRRIF